MPTYIYRRADGTTFEMEQRITEDALETCPTTGQPVTRVITGGTGLIFKGSGFYLTDYARTNGKDTEKAKTDAAKTDNSASKTNDEAAPKESKPAASSSE